MIQERVFLFEFMSIFFNLSDDDIFFIDSILKFFNVNLIVDNFIFHLSKTYIIELVIPLILFLQLIVLYYFLLIYVF